ncbi:regulatory protein [Williamsia sterculiae]|uniref:Regulatory protein RecX n=2 Tax=Williamsia sterculiae TaxID=1344003 RepID=A0A1N7EDW9_9NOCA|nr:regulatory protein [Williamsia sterculiae]
MTPGQSMTSGSEPEDDVRASLHQATADILTRSRATPPTAPDQRSGAVDLEAVTDPVTGRQSTGGKSGASCWDSALRLLGVRARSASEMRNRLLRKDFDPDEVDDVMRRLHDLDLLDDSAFADEWVRSRHTHSAKGRGALRRELRDKGVATETVERSLEQIDDEAERDRAAELLDRKLGRGDRAQVPDDPRERDKQLRRLVAMLVRRGYAPSLAMELVRDRLSHPAHD